MTERRSAVEHALDTQARQDRYSRERDIRDALEKASKALARGDQVHYAYVATTLRQRLLPTLAEHLDQPFSEYGGVLDGDPKWDWVAFSRFLRDPEAYVRRLSAAERTSQLAPGLADAVGEDTEARMTVRKTLDAVTAICEVEEIVMEDFQNRVDAVGFSVKLGEQLKRGDMDFGDPVEAVSLMQGALKHFYAGNTGSGKTVAASRQFEDYYRAQFEGGRRYKCLDYVGLGKAENIVFDIPQSQNDLQHAREEQNLPASYEGIEHFEPQQEVFVPLSDDVADTALPYNTDDGSFVVTPFTIPASDLSEQLLATLITAQVTPKKEQTIRDAYRVVDDRLADWSLADLAAEIRQRDDLSEKHTKDALRVLRTLQSSGFIRTAADDRTLDWDRLFRTTETISVFSQALLDSEIEQLTVVAYLLDQHWKRRREINDYVASAVWIRELWEIAGHQVQRRKKDDRVGAITKFIIDRLTKMTRKPRDISTHIIADTQEPNDVEKAVRRRFNRYVIFDSNDQLVEDVMGWEGESKRRAKESFLSTMSAHPGRGGIIGGCEPAIDPDNWGVSPVQFAPPSWHHHDKEDEGDAWTSRPEYVESEELRQPEWDVSVPEDLQVDVRTQGDSDETGGSTSTSAYDEWRQDAKQLACELHADGMSYSELQEELPANPRTGNPPSKATLSRWTDGIERRGTA